MGVENQVYDATYDGSETFYLYVVKIVFLFIHSMMMLLLDSREKEHRKVMRQVGTTNLHLPTI